jgi:hypothetical protein
MPPEEARELVANGEDETQSLYIVRHGDRWDYENPEVRAKRWCLPITQVKVSN